MTLNLTTTTDGAYKGQDVTIYDVREYGDDNYCIAIACSSMQPLYLNGKPTLRDGLFFQFSHRDIAFITLTEAK